MITQAADPEANIIFGAGIDENLEDEVHITVIATGFETNPFGSTAKAEPVKEAEKSAEPVRTETSSAPRRERMVELEEENDTPVSPIFERRSSRAPRPSREEMERRAQPAQRRPRVYQDGAGDDNRTRRGFTPDTPSFLKRQQQVSA